MDISRESNKNHIVLENDVERRAIVHDTMPLISFQRPLLLLDQHPTFPEEIVVSDRCLKYIHRKLDWRLKNQSTIGIGCKPSEYRVLRNKIRTYREGSGLIKSASRISTTETGSVIL